MYSSYLSKIAPSASMKVGLGVSQVPVTNLAIGVPDLVTHPEVRDILKAGVDANRFGYGPSKGTKAALSNLKRLLFADEAGLDPDRNLSLVNGAKYGVYLTLKTICNPGDQILLMQPYWLSYPEIVRSLGLDFHSWVPAVDREGNMEYDLVELENLVRTHHIKVLILNNPNNPSGHVFRNSWVKELNTILTRYDCWLVVDEVYKDLVFNREELGEFAISGDNVIRIGSLSKSLSIPGLRAGYLFGSEAFINNADLFNQHIQTCVNSLTVYLVEHISPATFHSFTDACSLVYKERYEVANKIFTEGGLGILNSNASFYSMVDFGNYFKDGQAACDHLAEKLHINTVAGLPYGDRFSSYVRICLTLPIDVLKEKFRLITNSLSNADF